MNKPRQHELDVADLKTGDLLLSMSDSEIGKLVAWLGNAKFSHASVVFDATQLIEATPPKVRLAPLAERVRKSSVEFIDVLRPLVEFSSGDESWLRSYGQSLVDRDYAKDLLAPLAVVAIARKATTFHPLLRRLLKWVIQHEISQDSTRLVCSELAYRLYDEPGYALRRTPQLPDLPVVTLPFPFLNPIKLAQEIRELFGQGAGNGIDPADAALDTAKAGEFEAILDELETLGEDPKALAPSSTLQGSAHDDFDAYCGDLWRAQTARASNGAVNPKTVFLLELWHSPSFSRLGRLRMDR